MKYGEFLRNNRLRGWEAQYLNYQALKDLLKQEDLVEEKFVQAIQREQSRLNHFVGGKVAEIVNSIEYLETQEDDFELAKSVAEQIDRLENYVRHNVTGFDKIVKKYKKHTGNSIFWYVNSKSDMWLYKASNIIHELIVQLSNFYKKHLEGPNATPWVPPASFSRNTTKYWVPPEHMTKLKCFIIQNVPILEVNRSKKVKTDFYTQKLDQSHNFVSSVYLDTPDLQCYHQRIRQEEGAELLRVRWYGGKVPKGGTVPVPDRQVMFMEQKIHHESWVDMSSTKQRFPLDQNLVQPFFDGRLSVEQAIEMMRIQGKIKDQDVTKMTEIAKSIHRAIHERGLKPSIRTTYHRTAFQRSNSNQVRISLDHPLYLLPETPRNNFWNDIQSPSVIEPFPFGILEIKLAGDEVPVWLEELYSKGWITKVSKFSKYQHASITYHQNKCNIVPHWIESLPEYKPDLSEEKLQGEQPAKSSPAVPNGMKLNSDAAVIDVDALITNGKNPDNGLRKRPLTSSKPEGSQKDAKSQKNPTLKKTRLERTKVEPKTYFANERTFIQWLSAAVLLVTLSTAVMSLSDTARLAGTLMFPVALMFLFYSLAVYRWRLGKINRRDGTRFDDPWGPWILTLFLSLAMVASLVIFWTHDDYDSTNVALAGMPGCVSQAEKRFETCQRTVLDTTLDSYELQFEVTGSVFDSAADRDRVFDQVEEAIRTCGTINTFAVNFGRTERLYCISNIDCYSNYVRLREDNNEIILKWRNVNDTFTPPTAAPSKQFEDKYELDSKCDSMVKAYSLKIEDAPSLPWDLSSVNSVLASPFYTSGELVYDTTRYRIQYEYSIVLAGKDSKVFIEVDYNSEEDRSMLRNPIKFQVQIRIDNNPPLSQIRQAEALLQDITYRVENRGIPVGAAIGIALACWAIFITIVIAAYLKCTNSPFYEK